MSQETSYYGVVVATMTKLNDRIKSGQGTFMDEELFSLSTNIINLFDECERFGFSPQDSEANDIIQNQASAILEPIQAELDSIPRDPFTKFYIDLACLKRALECIKDEYQKNLPTTLKDLENRVYKIEDYQQLRESFKIVGRQMINDELDERFIIIQRHIENQISSLRLRPEGGTDNNDTVEESSGENNFIVSTIEDWMHTYQNKLSSADYWKLIDALVQYCEGGSFPAISPPISFRTKINKKAFGWALNRVLDASGKSISVEVMEFASTSIALFHQESFKRDDFRKSNLYKYLTTNTG
jgi:hypothetical protein